MEEMFEYKEFPMGIYYPKNSVKMGVDVLWPIHEEPINPAMGKKLAINVAPTGAFISRAQNPTQPYTPQEISKEVIESYKEGASMFHIHCRRDGIHAVDPDIYKETLDLVFAEAPDIITNLCIISSSNMEGIERRQKPIIEPLHAFGKKYARAAVINPISYSTGQFPPFIATPVGVVTETQWLQEQGVKPFLAVYDTYSIDLLKELLMDSGIAQKPYYVGIGVGMHNLAPSHPDPEGYLNMLQVWKRLPKEGVVWEASCGGRNWLTMATFAIMLGCDIVRVGKEDALYKYPQKNEIITSCADVVKTIATIAKSLGREIATPEETRQMLGMEKL